MTYLWWWTLAWMCYDIGYQVAKMNGYIPKRWEEYSTSTRVTAFFLWAFNCALIFWFVYRGRP